MSAIITSIHNCPVKSISFQKLEKCKINKNIGNIFKDTNIPRYIYHCGIIIAKK